VTSATGRKARLGKVVAKAVQEAIDR